MYKLLTNTEITRLKNTITPIFKEVITINKKEKHFQICTNGNNENVDKNLCMLSGVCIEYANIVIIKNLVSEITKKEQKEFRAYFEFCSFVIDKLVELTKEHSIRSLLIHTNDITMLEILLKKEFNIGKNVNNFYKAFKIVMK